MPPCPRISRKTGVQGTSNRHDGDIMRNFLATIAIADATFQVTNVALSIDELIAIKWTALADLASLADVVEALRTLLALL